MSRQRIVLPASLRDVRLREEPVCPEMPGQSAQIGTTSDSESKASNVPENPAVIVKLLTSIETAIEELEQRRRQSVDEMQRATIELAVAVASRVVRQAIDADNYPVEELVRAMLSKLSTSDPVTVVLHPEDLTLLQQGLDGISTPWSADGSVTLKSDIGLRRGCCRAKTARTEIASDIYSQLVEMNEILLDGLEDAQDERRKPQTSGRELRRYPNRRETA